MSLEYEHGMADSGPTAGRSGVSDVLSARAREGVLKLSVGIDSLLAEMGDRSPSKQWRLAGGIGFAGLGIVQFGENMLAGIPDPRASTIVTLVIGTALIASSETTNPVN
jgi:hypothetical protein